MTRAPATVSGVTVPARFRHWTLHFEDPVFVLAAFVEWLESREREADGRGGPTAPASDRSAPRGEDEGMGALVRACMDVATLVPSAALKTKLVEALRAAGIEELDPAGDRFDPTQHFASGRTPTRDPALHNRISQVEEVGFGRRGDPQPLRKPRVTVYKLADGL